MKKRIFLKWSIWVPITLALVFGCGGKGKDVKTIQGDPESLYRQALARFNKRDYHEALKKFDELKSSFPDSPPYTVWAELKSGDCHFFKEEYVEATAAYEEFKKIHPGHEEIPYVQFQIGMSHFNQMRTLDRDQTSTKKALSSFEYLIANYPPSLFTEKAKGKIGVCKKRLADHEFYVGSFYYRQGKFQAAVSRLEGLLEKFPKDPEEDKALYLLGKSYFELGQWEKAEVAFRKIVTEYTKSPHYKEAQAILDKGIAGMEISHRKTKGTKKEDEDAAIEPDKISLIKFEEEGNHPVSLHEEKKVDLRTGDERSTSYAFTGESVTAVPPKKEEAKKLVLPPAIEPVQEDRVHAVPPSIEAKKADPVLPAEPMEEDRTQVVPPPLSAESASRIEVNPDEERRGTAVPSAPAPSPAPSKEKEKVDKKVPETKEAKLADPVDRSQPIDVTSDKVEARWKENLVIFKGNVIARQKDMVIYSDSLEVTTNEDGKGIERAIAGGNVKIQQGLRVANCEKAVFYNPDQKLVLTGDPKVSEGDNLVLGDEIILLIDKNRVEVKGGPSGRGKAKIQPGEIEKLK
jgi:outer membrane protein assembly factor BamD